MSEFTAHEPGTFCWVELMTTDTEKAKKFYGDLFGWDHHDDTVGENMIYTMLIKNGRSVAALYARNAAQAAQGVPSSWSSYVSVHDADATLSKVKAHGGEVILEAMDIFDIGRMGVFKDPTGATLCLWQPKSNIGAQLKNEPGAICWNELLTHDTERAGEFFERVFGWRRKRSDVGEMPYTEFLVGEQPVGGLVRIQAEWGDMPPHWLVYFAVADCDASVDRARNLGGAISAGPYDLEGVGRFAVVRDPQNASFAVIQAGREG